MIEARIGAECDVIALGVCDANAGDGGRVYFPGAFVGAGLYRFYEHPSFARKDCQPATLHGSFAQGDDAAAAVKAVGREDGGPDGVVVAKNLAVYSSVPGSCLAIEDGDVHPVRVGFCRYFHAGFAAGHVGALQVGLVDGF